MIKLGYLRRLGSKKIGSGLDWNNKDLVRESILHYISFVEVATTLMVIFPSI
jgi:hypothetical protein